MMKRDTFTPLCLSLHQAIERHALGDALSALRALATGLNMPEVLERCERIEENYHMMADYMVRGFRDDSRAAMYADFLRQTCVEGIKAERQFAIDEGLCLYATTSRALSLRKDLPGSTAWTNHENVAPRDLFDMVWTSPLWSQAECDGATAYVNDATHSSFDKALLVSATMLATLHHFDANKTIWLIRQAQHSDDEVRIRALTGAVLTTIYHNKCYALFPEIDQAWSELPRTEKTAAELFALQAALMLSSESKKIEHKINDEFLMPFYKKAQSLRKANKGLSLDSLRDELSRLDANPEWEKEERALSQQMMQMDKMRKQGVDVFLGSFKMLKQQFPFFSTAANWFAPFTGRHPDLPHDAQTERMCGLFDHMGMLCNSDRYTLILTLSAFAAQGQRGMAMDQFKTLMDQQGELPAEFTQTDSKAMIRSYVADLYRYFTLFRRRDMQVNPFACPLVLHAYPAIAALFHTPKRAHELGDLAFDLGLYNQAVVYYGQAQPTVSLLQKVGYCHQVAHAYDLALQAYERAELMDGDSVWTLRHLAACLRLKGDYPAALNVYRRLDTLCPEDAEIALHMGECMLQQERYDDARKVLFKAYYLKQDAPAIWRALAWCSLMTDHVDEARTYYAKLLEHDPRAEDLQNAGHAAWLAGSAGEALGLYLRYMHAKDSDYDPARLFEDDRHWLCSHGIQDEDIRIMCDVLHWRRLEM